MLMLTVQTAARTVLVFVSCAFIGALFLWGLTVLIRLARLLLKALLLDRPRQPAPRELYVVVEQGTNGICFSMKRHFQAGAIEVADFDQAKAVIDHRLARYLSSDALPSPHRFRLSVADFLISSGDLVYLWFASPDRLLYQVVHCDCRTAPPFVSPPIRHVTPSAGFSSDDKNQLVMRAYAARG